MTVAEIGAALAWAALAVDVLWRRPRPAANAIVAGWRPRGPVRMLAALGTASAIVMLERMTGALPASRLQSGVGLGIVLCGLLLHFAARRALGPWWDATVAVRQGQPVVTSGPYAAVRHPLYLAVLLMALGTLAVHPSLAAACVVLGLTLGTLLKVRAEDALLRRVFGATWEAWAADVPALIPSLRRGRR